MAETLEVYDAIPESALVIVAHPDDAEFMCAGTVARWARGGSRVVILVVTNGNKGSSDPAVDPAELARTRHREQREAARILGAHDVVFLDYEDGMVEPSLALRRDIARVIRAHKPQAAICQDPGRYAVGTDYINHPDHRAVADAALGAIYPAARDRLTFPELAAAGYEPHKVAEVFLAFVDHPTVVVDISDTLEAKVAALRAHASQMGEWDPTETVGQWAQETAKGQPFAYAEAFRYLKLGE